MRETENIKKHEVVCKHCGEEYMVQVFIDFLQFARDIVRIPFPFNSAWRCLYYNRIIGSQDTSSHLKGLAADLKTKTPKIRMVMVGALVLAAEEFKDIFDLDGYKLRIIIYPEDGFIHVDIDPAKPKGLWVKIKGELK